ncbi:BamA/OMP85 family outer membrane protein [Candidatus Karelsulcia muelleri]|uniref:BamA/OMP85 family outer membrane protein n=1 Tax=Candidatus Karelsulcia muelleri TaxID=336810 RepID=UPI0013A614BE|nr:POTRA domain-containing protein [Candidatus Karelsulcia muelleri]
MKFAFAIPRHYLIILVFLFIFFFNEKLACQEKNIIKDKDKKNIIKDKKNIIKDNKDNKDKKSNLDLEFKKKIDPIQFEKIKFEKIDQIQFEGISKEEINEIIYFWELTNNPPTDSSDFIESLKIFIKNYFNIKGYRDILLYLKIKNQSQSQSQIKLIISINKGKLMTIKNISFEGNNFFSEKQLNKMKPHYKMSYPSYEEYKKKIIMEYKKNGFKKFKISSEEFKKINSKYYSINLKFIEGNQYKFSKLSFNGNKNLNDEILKKKLALNLKEGDFYNIIEIQNSIQRIVDFYLNKGYAFSKISLFESEKEDNLIDVIIIIEENEKITINKVNIIGNNQVKDEIIFRELTTIPGNLFSKKEIEKSITNLKNLNLFYNVQMQMQIVPNYKKNTLDLNLVVYENRNSELKFKGNFQGKDLLGEISLNINNFSLLNCFHPKNFKILPYGDNQKVLLDFTIGKKLKKYNVSFIHPNLTDSSSMKFNFFYKNELPKESHDLNFRNLENNDNYKINKFKSTIELNKKINENNNLLFNINYINKNKIYKDKTLSFSEKSNLYKDWNSQLIFNHNSISPDIILPQKGGYVNINSFLEFPKSLKKFNKFEYFKFQIKSFWYKKIFKKLISKIGYEFGVLHNSNKNDDFKQFYMGGTSFQKENLNQKNFIPLRGYYEPNKLYGVISPKNGGSFYEKILTELRYLICEKNSFKLWILNFFEAGNLFDSYKNFNPFKLKRSIGTGIRCFLNNIGLLEFDLTYRLDKTLDNVKPNWKVNFAIGHELEF